MILFLNSLVFHTRKLALVTFVNLKMEVVLQTDAMFLYTKTFVNL